MDGNGRWAVEKGLPRFFGHRKGAAKVTEIVKACPDLRIKTLTLYAFSTENWNRAAHEVSSLMRLFRGYLQNKFFELVNNNVKVVFIGDANPIASDIVKQMRALVEATNKNNGLTLNIALNYGGRDEIVRSTKKIATDVLKGELNPEDLNEHIFNSYLDTANQGDPDLVIRTAGNKRISNFLLWQIAYTELYFTNTFWPDISVDKIKEILEICKERKRTFGTNKIHTYENYV